MRTGGINDTSGVRQDGAVSGEPSAEQLRQLWELYKAGALQPARQGAPAAPPAPPPLPAAPPMVVQQPFYVPQPVVTPYPVVDPLTSTLAVLAGATLAGAVMNPYAYGYGLPTMTNWDGGWDIPFSPF